MVIMMLISSLSHVISSTQSLRGGLFVISVLFLVLEPIIRTLQAMSSNAVAGGPADKGKTAEQAPSEQFALPVYAHGKSEQASTDERAKAAPGCRKGLGNTV